MAGTVQELRSMGQGDGSPAYHPRKRRKIGTVKETLTLLVQQVGGADLAGARIGRHPKKVQAMIDPNVDGLHMRYAEVVALTSPASSAAAQQLAAMAGGRFVPDPEFLVQQTPATHIAMLAREFAEVMDEWARAESDGVITQAEWREIAKDLRPLAERANGFYSHAIAMSGVEAGE